MSAARTPGGRRMGACDTTPPTTPGISTTPGTSTNIGTICSRCSTGMGYELGVWQKTQHQWRPLIAAAAVVRLPEDRGSGSRRESRALRLESGSADHSCTAPKERLRPHEAFFGTATEPELDDLHAPAFHEALIILHTYSAIGALAL